MTGLNILVTGGAGFIGSHVTALLLQKGHRVTVFDNLSTGYRENVAGECELLVGDVRDRDSVVRACRSRDIVIHLAASVGNLKSLADPHTDGAVNVAGTRNVLDAVVTTSVSTLLFASSAAIYGVPKYLPIDEAHPCEPDSPYGVSKLAGEKDVLCLSRIRGFRSVCFRPFNVYGTNQRFDAYGNVIPIFFSRLANHEPLTVYGDGTQTRDFVNVKDVAAAFVSGSEVQTANGVFNLGSGDSRSINNLISLLSPLVGWKIAVQYDKPRSGEVLHSSATIEKMKKELHFTPQVDFQRGLLEYWEWFRDQVSFR